MIAEMNAGKFGENDLKAATNLQIGAAVNPNVEGQVERLKEKIAAGVQFIQTQPIFSRAKFDQFLTELKKERVEIPILFGMMPLKNVKVAEFFNNSVPGVEIPPSVLAQLRDDPEVGVRLSLELFREIKEEIDGIHLMPLGNHAATQKIYQEFKKNIPKND